jgi:hypothetical protein
VQQNIRPTRFDAPSTRLFLTGEVRFAIFLRIGQLWRES